MSDDYPGGWFGASWGAPVCEENRHLPTPVGDRCVACSFFVKEDDRGMIIPFAGMRPAVLMSYHLGCYLREILPADIATEILWKAEHYEVERQPYETKWRCACAADFATKQELAAHINRAPKPDTRGPLQREINSDRI